MSSALVDGETDGAGGGSVSTLTGLAFAGGTRGLDHYTGLGESYNLTGKVRQRLAGDPRA